MRPAAQIKGQRSSRRFGSSPHHVRPERLLFVSVLAAAERDEALMIRIPRQQPRGARVQMRGLADRWRTRLSGNELCWDRGSGSAAHDLR